MQVRNLPTITFRYWSAILAASMCGANTGDFMARILHLGHAGGLIPLAALFFVILWTEKRARVATEVYYWLAVIVLRTAATNLADLATHDLGLRYVPVLLGLTSILVVALLIDFARDGSSAASELGRKRVSLPSTDVTYWVALLTAGVLGTAGGDFVAAGLGFAYGSIILGAIYGVVLLIATRGGGMTKTGYWMSIVAARTAGTTMGDVVARHIGLSLSTVCTGLLLASIIALRKEKRPVEVG